MFSQRRQGLPGPEFLDKPQDCIEDDDSQNCDCINPFLQQTRDYCRADEDPDDQARKLGQEDLDGRGRRSLRQFIWTNSRKTMLGFMLSQPVIEVGR